MTDIVASPAELPGWAEGRINLASPRLGTRAHRCSDDFFAPMERMLQDTPAIFKPGLYDDNGKWMDGWECRRRRDGGDDWCVLKLGVTGRIAGVDIDTSHFTGNFPPAASVWGGRGASEPGEADWVVLVPPAELGPSAHHLIAAESDGPFDWIRVNMLPDGGIARFRLYGDPVPSWAGQEDAVELSSLRNGGRVLAWNDAHYGDIWAVLSEGRGQDTGDGWETRRRREPGYDWLIVALGAPGEIERIEIDTACFKGNFPDRASLQAAALTQSSGSGIVTQAMFWPELMAEKKLQADHVHVFSGDDLAAMGPVSHVKLNIHPDGGISRFRVFGRRV